MNHETGFFTILRVHLPIFAAAFFMALFAMSLATMIVLQQHVSDPEQNIQYYFQAIVVLSVYLCSANLLVVRGRPWGVWLVVALMLACILTVVLGSGYRVPRIMYFLGLFFPLVALLLLNTRRHRAMREVMVKVRAERAAIRNKRKKR
ncbi:hypothetical protein NRB16_27635 [Pseudomonas sp. LJDD11]|uniref:hypothetical protein n=1 Tax=unclassified Pseudomonas TaxID=196821 RepID=UPI00209755B7|nr:MULTISPECIES: hypothetical protein [unclassified Pseudomonas]MCO8164743.1 hypothetical protein [Pseudomonas sp. 21LCFQ010]MCQ9427291.1 hypothetical protein [Pseudomonas sp. LJDD11]